MLKNAYSQVNTLRNLLGRVHYVNSCGCIMAYLSMPLPSQAHIVQYELQIQEKKLPMVLI